MLLFWELNCKRRASVSRGMKLADAGMGPGPEMSPPSEAWIEMGSA